MIVRNMFSSLRCASGTVFVYELEGTDIKAVHQHLIFQEFSLYISDVCIILEYGYYSPFVVPKADLHVPGTLKICPCLQCWVAGTSVCWRPLDSNKE
jgi:hypothetical protein